MTGLEPSPALSELGRYRVVRPLGGGSTGDVYLCRHPGRNQPFAVKVLSGELLRNDATALTRFRREARAASALLHPNVVRTHEIEEGGGRPFLVMEYVDGLTIEDLARRQGGMDVDQACNYVSQALHGLDYIYQAGMVHRDLKPTNLLVDRTGVVKVLDLGLVAYTDDRGDRLTEQFPRILGTLDFMAPEQAERSSGVDIRADIYSLGATLYYLLTGSTPLPSGTIAGKLIAMQFHAPKSLREFRPDIDPALDQIILKMLTKSPKNRYETPLEVVQALAPWVKAERWPPDAALIGPPEAMPPGTSVFEVPDTLSMTVPITGGVHTTTPSLAAMIDGMEVADPHDDDESPAPRSGSAWGLILFGVVATLLSLFVIERLIG